MHKRLTIGQIELETPVLLAPMAGYTDLSFRLEVRALGGLGLAFSEMVNPRSFMVGKAKKVAQLLATSAEDEPLSFQIYGHEPQYMADGAKWLYDRGAKMIDINMGCPQRKIAGRGDGAGLLKTPRDAVALAHKVVNAVTIPVTVKIRLVPPQAGILTSELVRELELAGVAAITVHPRTCAQMFEGHSDWSAIRAAVEAVKTIPIIGNGDILTSDDAITMIRETGCSGVMLGRAAVKNPWLIRNCAAALSDMPEPPPPSRADRLALMIMHLDRMTGQYGEDKAPLLFRKWIPPYARSMRVPRDHMVRILKLRGLDEVRREISAL
ncbi:MAG: tRNA-dihydrouridine synthase [bacterium]